MKRRNKFRKYYLHSMAEDGGDPPGGGGDGSGDPPGDGGDPPPGDGDGDGGSGTAVWPEDWQTRFSKGDDKLQERAGRYSSPEAVFDALVASQNKLRSGEYVAKLPEKPTDEQLVEWRESNGIPKNAEGYTFEGMDIDEADRGVLGELTKRFLDSNMSSEQARSVVSWVYQNADNEQKILAEDDEREERESTDSLNAEWGGHFRLNQNKISNMITMLPEAIRDDFMQARLPNGTKLMNSVDVMRGLAQLAKTLDPSSRVTPVDGDPMIGVESEIDEIEKFMRTNRAEYNRDEKKQSRLRELYEARDYRKAG